MWVSMPVSVVSMEVRKVARFSGAGVAGDCEQPHEAWEHKLGPLEKHGVLLTPSHLSSPLWACSSCRS